MGCDLRYGFKPRIESRTSGVPPFPPAGPGKDGSGGGGSNAHEISAVLPGDMLPLSGVTLKPFSLASALNSTYYGGYTRSMGRFRFELLLCTRSLSYVGESLQWGTDDERVRGAFGYCGHVVLFHEAIFLLAKLTLCLRRNRSDSFTRPTLCNAQTRSTAAQTRMSDIPEVLDHCC